MKNKIDQDMVAMIIADFQHGELTTCTCECKDCPLYRRVNKDSETRICDLLTEISVLLDKVEYDD